MTNVLFPLQEVNDTPRIVNKVDEYFREVKDNSPLTGYKSVLKYNAEKKTNDTLVFGVTQQGNMIDTTSKIVKVMGPDQYFNNVPKDQ